MKLTDLNRQGGIGANSLFLQIGALNILIDCGLNPKTPGLGALPDFNLLKGVELDLIIITHCHLDHIGGLPVVMRQHPKTPVLLTQSSRMLIEKMLHNSANVMQKQKEEDNVPGYPLFTHEEVDRLVSRFVGSSALANTRSALCFTGPVMWPEQPRWRSIIANDRYS